MPCGETSSHLEDLTGSLLSALQILPYLIITAII